jgi:hypothetical protein
VLEKEMEEMLNLIMVLGYSSIAKYKEKLAAWRWRWRRVFSKYIIKKRNNS